jgi:hypothetical protein
MSQSIPLDTPLVFLDLDGVINDHTEHDNGYCGSLPWCVAQLNRILRQTGANIVISSTWRYLIPEAMTPSGFQCLLLSHGIDCRDRIVGMTCRDEELMPRGRQIRQWLDSNTNGSSPPYLVLDDLDLGIREFGHPFVQTDWKVGLTSADADAAIELLCRTLNGQRSSQREPIVTLAVEA